MSHITRRRAAPLVPLLASALAASLVGCFLVVMGAPAQAAPTDVRSCGWAAQISPDKVNVAYPDSAATYWIAAVPIPPGGRVELAGEYPHARYMSFVSYGPTTAATDGLNDLAIRPEAGSTNPFVEGADRSATQRRYRVSVVNGAPPAVRPANTLYNVNPANALNTAPLNVAVVVYRVYVPDAGRDLAGGTALPSITVRTADGTGATLPTCRDLVPSTSLTSLLASASLPSLLPVGGLLGTRTPTWRRFTNLLSAVVANTAQTQYLQSLYPGLTGLTDQALPPGGFFENPDNKYVSASVDPAYGQVLVLRAKAPTTPRTQSGQRRMGSGQVRYWSMCSEAAQTTQLYDCVFDEQVPLDAQGYYTIVVSSAKNRPANATARCGAAWLPSGPLPESLLILRNMLPSADFHQAVQDAAVNQEKQALGEYYPVGTYVRTTADYERRGCASTGGTR